ncbi:hypothetical protein ABBQ38_011081 [Trebouxia sp. C0009 RCD-2024]
MKEAGAVASDLMVGFNVSISCHKLALEGPPPRRQFVAKLPPRWWALHTKMQEHHLTAGGGEQAPETGVPDVVLAPGTRRRFRFVEPLLPVAPPSAPALEPPAI